MPQKTTADQGAERLERLNKRNAQAAANEDAENTKPAAKKTKTVAEQPIFDGEVVKLPPTKDNKQARLDLRHWIATSESLRAKNVALTAKNKKLQQELDNLKSKTEKLKWTKEVMNWRFLVCCRSDRSSIA